MPRRQLRSRKIPVRFREVQIPVPHPLLSCQNRSCRSPSSDVHLILHLATSTLRRQWRWALQERDESPSIVALEVPSALHQQNASVLSQENSLDPDCWDLCNLVGFGPSSGGAHEPRMSRGRFFPAEQTARPTTYLSGKGEFRSWKNTNCCVGILRRSEPSSAGIEVVGCQFVTNLGRPSAVQPRLILLDGFASVREFSH